jgi:hypothetical protein
MVAEKLVEMIEIHAGRLAADVAQDLVTNARTPSFRSVTRADLEERLFQIVHHLGSWISNRRSEKVRGEFSEWGGKRFGQGIPLSEIIFAVILLKQHLRHYIQQNGLIEAAFPSSEGDYVLPMHLHSLQELNAQIGLFFDEALYHLTSGYETRARQGAGAR